MIGSFIPSGIPTAAAFATTDWSRFPSDLQRLPGVQAQKGDIIIYACNSGPGHIAVYESDYVTYHQNYNGRFVERIDGTYYQNARKTCCYYWGVIRPDFTSKLEITPADLGTDFTATMIFDYGTSGNASVISGAGTTKGSNVEISKQNGEWKQNQLWTFKRQNDGTYLIKNNESNLYLNVENSATNTENGTNIELYEATGFTAQSWYLVSLNGGGYRFIPRHCYDSNVKAALDINNGATTAGTNVQLWGYTGDASDANGFAQKIYIEKILSFEPADLGTDFTATMVFDYGISGNASVISGAGTTKGSNVEISKQNGKWKQNQLWTFKRQNDGTYLIKNNGSDLYLNVENSATNTENGTNIELYEATGFTAQSWYLVLMDGGGYRLIPRHCYDLGAKKGLDIQGGSTAVGTNARLWEYTGEATSSSSSQRIYIEKTLSFEPADLGTDFTATMIFDYGTSGNASVISGAGTTKGSNVEISKQNGEWKQNQLWTFKRQNDGTYLIKNNESDLYLNVEDSATNTENGTNIELYEATGFTAQSWYLVSLNGGGYRLIPRHCYDFGAKRGLDIQEGSTVAGTNVRLWSFTGDASDVNGFAQRIYIEKYTAPTYNLGDINGDTKIDALDAKLALQYFTGKETLTAEQFARGDVTKDGTINALDAKEILRYFTGKISEF